MKFHFPARALILTAALTATMAVSAYAYDVQGGTVTTSSAVNFRQEATTQSESMGKLSDGTRVAILDETDGWYKVAYNGEVGYMSADYVESQPIMNIECGGAKVTTSVLNMRSGPGTENSIVTKLYEGSVAKIIGINNAWFKVQYGGETGYISPDYVSIVPYKATATASAPVAVSTSSGSASTASGTRQQIIDYAAKFLGCKYVYGGNTPSGFDCSGYVKYVFKHFGVELTRTSANQYANSVKIKKSELKIGDLVFFSQNAGSSKVGHVGIYVGGGQFIHAAAPGKGVRYDSLNSTYYSSHYIGSGRVLSN
ncbi:MAG: C40 family peptidase [Clostridia bacterium]|nr:C40 family peptidase [Clostridia bacterium]